MELILTNLLEEVSVYEVTQASEASMEVVRQYQEDPSMDKNLVMMAFN